MNKAFVFFFVFLSSLSQAALHYRGSGMVYDDVLDITWLQDANYAQTSGWAGANQQYIPHTFPDNVQLDGSMGSWAGQDWVEQLDYAGFNDWRLPTALVPDLASSCGYEGYAYGGVDLPGCTGELNTGELGHMFYNNLGNTGPATNVGCDVYPDSCLLNTSFVDATTGLTYNFVNVGSDYWYSDVPDSWPNQMAFSFDRGEQQLRYIEQSKMIWAVRDGDVAESVPEVDAANAPMAMALLAGVIGLLRERAVRYRG